LAEDEEVGVAVDKFCLVDMELAMELPILVPNAMTGTSSGNRSYICIIENLVSHESFTSFLPSTPRSIERSASSTFF
jgi:hypothetical protein